jgi:hypothetical protein
MAKDVRQEAARLLAIEIRAAMELAGLNDTALQKSVEVVPRGNQMLDVLTNFYGEFVIRGRKPGTKKVPISALVAWIKRKRLQGRDKRGRFISANSLAYAIQTAIYKRGIKGRDFVTPAVDSWSKKAAEAIGDELQRMLDEELDKWQADRAKIAV